MQRFSWTSQFLGASKFVNIFFNTVTCWHMIIECIANMIVKFQVLFSRWHKLLLTSLLIIAIFDFNLYDLYNLYVDFLKIVFVTMCICCKLKAIVIWSVGNDSPESSYKSCLLGHFSAMKLNNSKNWMNEVDSHNSKEHMYYSCRAP